MGKVISLQAERDKRLRIALGKMKEMIRNRGPIKVIWPPDIGYIEFTIKDTNKTKDT